MRGRSERDDLAGHEVTVGKGGGRGTSDVWRAARPRRALLNVRLKSSPARAGLSTTSVSSVRVKRKPHHNLRLAGGLRTLVQWRPVSSGQLRMCERDTSGWRIGVDATGIRR